MGKEFIFFFYKANRVFQEPAENLECPELVAAFMAEQKEKKEKQQTSTSTSKTNETSNGKRSHSTNNNTDEDNNNNTSQTKRSRIELEQTGYGRNLVPDTLMGATDIYDGELMFL